MLRSRINFLINQYIELRAIVVKARQTVASIADPNIKQIYVHELAPLEFDLRVAIKELSDSLDQFFEVEKNRPVDMTLWKIRNSIKKEA